MECGLLGRKLGHSYSPQIHACLGDYSYTLFEKEPEEVADFLKNGDFTGLNVTIPYKKTVIPYLDELSPAAKKLGAVNTVVRREDGTLFGHNTDYFGFASLLKRSGLDVAGKKVLVLGSGGASNTVTAVLTGLGAEAVVISRSGENNYENLQRHEDAAVIVNATPVGMYPNTGVSPVDLKRFPKLEGVLDVIYNPARTQLLLGKEAMEKLHGSRVAVFGIGGVGGYTVEALARSGVGALDLIDDDKVCLTNLNRQIVATRKTVGQYKVDVAEQRIHDIDPNIKVTTYKIFFTPETQDQFDFTQYDYVVDAIDTVTGKIALVVKAKEAGTPIICAMGAGNKMDPTRFEVTDIYKTSVCPLAKVMRTECRKRKIKHLKVVYSKEPAMTPIEDDSISCKNHCICPPGTQRKCTVRRSVPGSNAFVPSVAGLIIGGEVVKDLVGFVPMKG